ncbi:MAG: hypothetical protein P0Y56_13235 [Candidatus Andeanibacterium colombiense]|uniref:Uncharacterized protein n=1 Tax=Candidatus Andeanibacterium colombiense TaxID=3121345 RepID=A0AAJ6BM31_9SPHN|nr:MAG: hypothetical protein P0Y56_13235 [Sphingomonadaceae bacterium]
MTPDQLFDDFEAGFPNRKFTAGLLVALIDLFEHLDTPNRGFANFDELLVAFPRQTANAQGKQVNQLSVFMPDGKTVGIRSFYNKAERFYRAEHKRFDYPSAAPHATQAWPDYKHWLDALATISSEQLAELRGRVNQFVLDTLKSQEFDPATIEVEPPLFRLLLEDFDMAAKVGEKTGAAFQGIVFGFLRADNPHLQIEIDKVRTGSKRLQRVGDVDGWEGSRLAISAEVKQYKIGADAVPDLEDFANRTGRRGALGVIAATGFDDGVREALEAIGLIPLDVTDMLRIVELWDPIKQRTAVASFVYYANHVEKNSSLSDRLTAFLSEAGATWLAGRKAVYAAEAAVEEAAVEEAADVADDDAI